MRREGDESTKSPMAESEQEVPEEDPVTAIAGIPEQTPPPLENQSPTPPTPPLMVVTQAPATEPPQVPEELIPSLPPTSIESDEQPPAGPPQAVSFTTITPPTAPPTAPPTTPAPSNSITLEQIQAVREKCYSERDFGLIEHAVTSTKVFCADPYDDANTNGSGKRTKVTLIQAPTRLRAPIFQDLLLDLTHAKPNRPIRTIAQDGGAHDPKFVFHAKMIYCACDEFHQYITSAAKDAASRLNVWDPAFVFTKKADKTDPSLTCTGANKQRSPELLTEGDNLITFTGKSVVIARRDDHNPFFQVSNALNAWIIMKALEWDPHDVTVVHLDAGYPSQIDELHKKLLAPTKEVVRGSDLVGKRLIFTDEVMLAPYETWGPMMEHLDDFEPCHASELMKIFRDVALEAMEATPSTTRTRIVVTVISRKPYSGRKIQRVWRNEDEVVDGMKKEYVEYQGLPIVIQSIDFVNLPLQEQMQIMLDSDVVISMHGAGMVNVMWTKPGTLVVEIFPAKRKRWGYRNLCQFLDCDWHEFRGGKDIPTGKDANSNDKIVPYEVWRQTFDPLFQKKLAEIDAARQETEPGNVEAGDKDGDEDQADDQPVVASEFKEPPTATDDNENEMADEAP